MYLYYDKTRTLKTAISHGEPIRQNSDVNIFVCLDEDFFEDIGISEDKIELSEIVTSVTYENGEFGTNGNTSDTPELLLFEKINASEITYYLKNKEIYWIYRLKFDFKEISLYPGQIFFNANLIIDDKSYAFGTANLFVEARTGLPTPDNSINQTEYDNITNRLNKISNRVTILEKIGFGSSAGKITNLTNSVWYFNDSIIFDSLVSTNQEISFEIDFISNNNQWSKMKIIDATDSAGFNLISYISAETSNDVYTYWDSDEDGTSNWDSEKGDFKKIEIIGGIDATTTKLIDWLYENATYISGGDNENGLILDNYYDKKQIEERFATKLELSEEIMKILGEGTIESLDSIKELSEAIGNNPNFYEDILELIGNSQGGGDVSGFITKLLELENNVSKITSKLNSVKIATSDDIKDLF